MLLLRRYVAVVVLIIATLPLFAHAVPPLQNKQPKGLVVAELKPDAPDWVQQFFKDAEDERLRQIQAKQIQLKALNSRSLLGNIARDRLRKETSAIESEIEILLKDPVVVRSFEGLGAGQSNNFIRTAQVLKFREEFHVQQVLANDCALLIIAEEYLSTMPLDGQIIPDKKVRRTPVILKGVPTKNWSDGSGQRFGGILRVTGTGTYSTAGHGTNMALVLEPFDPIEYIVQK